MKALELFAGLGGFAFAAKGLVDRINAIDVSEHLVALYARNHDCCAHQANLEGISLDTLASFDADLWWMSPPCQPYTVRGLQRDLEDPRARSFKRLLAAIESLRPPHLCMENVSGFRESQARQELLRILTSAGYTVEERIVCPTELGIPNRRPRYYLAASRTRDVSAFQPKQVGKPLDDYLDASPEEALFLSQETIDKYGPGFDVVHPDDDAAITTCFTSAYGRSWTQSGSYLEYADKRLRRFSPAEILRFMHFPDTFRFSDEFTLKQQWKYAGNSLNVAVVRTVLESLGI